MCRNNTANIYSIEFKHEKFPIIHFEELLSYTKTRKNMICRSIACQSVNDI